MGVTELSNSICHAVLHNVTTVVIEFISFLAFSLIKPSIFGYPRELASFLGAKVMGYTGSASCTFRHGILTITMLVYVQICCVVFFDPAILRCGPEHCQDSVQPVSIPALLHLVLVPFLFSCSLPA